MLDRHDDSRGLVQLTVAAALPGDRIKAMFAVADVSALVRADSRLDAHAGADTISIYMPQGNCPVLPERLSTDLTSLAPGQDRLALVVEFVVDGQGVAESVQIDRAVVHN